MASSVAGRSGARWSLFFAVIWLGGFGSLVAVPLGALAVFSAGVDRRHRVVGAAGFVLGIIGLVGAVALYLSSI